jgi:hypothetical protein
MRATGLLLSILICSANPLLAQDAPEDLLPTSTQLYARWDGVTAHAGLYAKTALGKMLAGDMGTFLTGLVRQVQETSGKMLTGEQVLKGVDPERLQQIQADVNQAMKLVPALAQHGIVLGAEVRRLEPPTAQITVIIPDMGKDPRPLFGTLHLLKSGLETDIKELKVAGRNVYHLQLEPQLHLAWWVEGKHAVFTFGTDIPQACVERMTKPGPRLASHPLFQRVQGFKKFETGARAFVDVASIVKIARTRSNEVSKFLSDLGLEGVSSWTFYSGFDGTSERALSELELKGPRQGLLRLLSGKTFKLKDVPAIPPDAYSWSATNFDPGVSYDVGLRALESGIGVFSPEMAPMISGFLKQADDALAINIRRDLLGSLGDRFAMYASPVDGPLSFGQVYLFKVKDAAKLQTALSQALRSIGKLTGVEVTVQKKTYRGVAVQEVHVRQPGFIVFPSYAIQGDYLAVALFPQPIHGFILRSRGELPVWKPSARIEAALQKLPGEFVAISISDPRPTIKELLSVAPFIGGAIASFYPEVKFDFSSIPNGHEVSSHLFPNVTVVSDDGKSVRSDTLASLMLPVDLVGIDSYTLLTYGAGFLFSVVGK